MLLYETNDFLVMFLVPPLPGRAPVAFRQLRPSARGLRGKELGRGGDRPQEVAAAPCRGRGGEEGNNHCNKIDGKAKCITA